MNQFKLSVLFYLDKMKLNKKNQCPVKCRLTFLKTRRQFSTGLFVNPDYWNSKQQLAKPPNKQNNITNTHLSLISQKINEAFLLLQISSEDFDVDDIYSETLLIYIRIRSIKLKLFIYQLKN
ncbi:Arm DNA-binding domain-containing protein [Tenacibaculum insulae]|uniref:Arm DNA-binding domain-containing protein n=1 Tax=Tenacibaculum insulae TaxID=2029677 RepID=UPI003AB4046D